MERKDTKAAEVIEATKPGASPVELSDAELEEIGGGGAGKVSMQDFHFVMRVSKATPTFTL